MTGENRVFGSLEELSPQSLSAWEGMRFSGENLGVLANMFQTIQPIVKQNWFFSSHQQNQTELVLVSLPPTKVSSTY